MTVLFKLACGTALLLGLALESTASASPDEVSSLSYFIGTWNCQGVFPSNGKSIASTIRFGNDGTSVIKHHDDLPRTPIIVRSSCGGYSTTDRRFNAVILDNFGATRDFSSSGWVGDAFVWTSAPQVSPQQQFAYARVSDNSFRLDWRVFKNGVYVVGDTLTCVRET